MKVPTHFAPYLFLRNVLAGMEFYKKAFAAVELRRWSNDDGSVHVVEMMIDGAMFHLHQEVPKSGQLSAETVKATTSSIGLFTDNPDRLVDTAIAAGAKVLHPLQDYDYGYRQATIIDPFGHQWLIEKQI